jgi:6-phosphofructo-2-kinase
MYILLSFNLLCFYACVNIGDFHGMSQTTIKRLFPAEYKKRKANKLTYRYPGAGGESYLDVIERVKPIIIELERQRSSVVVVCHLAALRCIHAYFMGTDVQELPYATFKKHTVYVLSPGPTGCTCKAVDPTSEL